MELHGAHVLVTGGAGFIGSHLVEALLGNGAKVTVIDDLSSGSLANLSSCLEDVKFLKMDILSPQAQGIVAKGRFDLVYHMASNAYVPPSVENPASDLSINLLATFRLLETIRLDSPKTAIVNMSSAAVYGNPKRIPIEESFLLAPISPYGASKLAAECYVTVYSLLYSLKTASLRLFSVYGPRQTKQVIYDLIDKIHHNPEELQLYGDGSQIRDFCYVDDVIGAALVTATRGCLGGEVYNVASATGCSIRELAQLICRIVGVSPVYIFSGSVRAGDAQHWIGDISRLRALGYSPRVSLASGIARTFQWYKQKVLACP